MIAIPAKIIVTGGRQLDPNRVAHWLHANLYATLATYGFRGIDILAEGGAPGADTGARMYSHQVLRPDQCKRVDADWRWLGAAAGPIRNREMFHIVKPHLLLAFPGNTGTANMIAIVQEHNNLAHVQPTMIVIIHRVPASELIVDTRLPIK